MKGKHFTYVSQHKLMVTPPHLPALLNCLYNSALCLLSRRVVPGECNDGGGDSGSATQPASWHLQHHGRGERQWLPRTAPYHGNRPHNSPGGEQCRPDLGVSQRHLRNCASAGGQSSSLCSGQIHHMICCLATSSSKLTEMSAKNVKLLYLF